MKNLSTNKPATKQEAKIYTMCENTLVKLKAKGLSEDIATSMIVDTMKHSGGDVVMLKSLFVGLIEVA